MAPPSVTPVPSSPAPTSPQGELDPELVRLVQRAVPGAQLQRVRVLGADDGAAAQRATAKAVGYGVVLRIDADVGGVSKSFVLHGASPNQFGHDRRADRAAEMLLAADTFGLIPRHTRALDVGTLRADGTSVSLLDSGEFYLLTDYAVGHPYADDLRHIAARGRAEPEDVRRVALLADYLATLHAERHQQPFAYERSLRDLLGGGEGIFGIVDAYGAGGPGADRASLQRIERACLEWRWKLKQRAPRLARIHGDFHPFNVLFDDQAELRVLDTSRGSLGDPADDVACLAINYVFFALESPASWTGAFQGLWHELWSHYLKQSRDGELLDVVAPYLAWRVLVLACPAWYPSLGARNRERLLTFAERALSANRFEPQAAESVFQ